MGLEGDVRDFAVERGCGLPTGDRSYLNKCHRKCWAVESLWLLTEGLSEDDWSGAASRALPVGEFSSS